MSEPTTHFDTLDTAVAILALATTPHQLALAAGKAPWFARSHTRQQRLEAIELIIAAADAGYPCVRSFGLRGRKEYAFRRGMEFGEVVASWAHGCGMANFANFRYGVGEA